MGKWRDWAGPLAGAIGGAVQVETAVGVLAEVDVRTARVINRAIGSWLEVRSGAWIVCVSATSSPSVTRVGRRHASASDRPQVAVDSFDHP